MQQPMGKPSHEHQWETNQNFNDAPDVKTFVPEPDQTKGRPQPPKGYYVHQRCPSCNATRWAYFRRSLGKKTFQLVDSENLFQELYTRNHIATD